MQHVRMRGRRALAVAVALGSTALVAGGVGLLGYAAHAALVDVPPTGTPGRLVLSADPYPAEFLGISPGEPAYWQVGARLEDASSATLSLELRKDGEVVAHPRGLTMTVDECAQEWTGLTSSPVCSTGSRRIAVATPADDDRTSSPIFPLAPLTAAAPDHLLVTLAVEDSAEARADTSLMGLTGNFGVGLTAVAIDDTPVGPDEPAAQGSGRLPATGVDLTPMAAIAALSAGLLGLGAAFRLGRRTSTDRKEVRR